MKTQRNFHVPLPEELYQALRQESEKSQQPATTLAREAIKEWIKRREQEAIHQAITDYAQEMAGGEADLDPELEEASLMSWREA